MTLAKYRRLGVYVLATLVLGWAAVSTGISQEINNGPALDRKPDLEQGQTNIKPSVDTDRSPIPVIVTKSYSLKFASPSEFLSLVKPYMVGEPALSGNTIVVRLYQSSVPAFEELLKKYDVEKKSVLFRIYPVFASRNNPEAKKTLPPTPEIKNPELKKVLDELKGLWNFERYEVDSPSLLLVKEDSGSNMLRLVSAQSSLRLHVLYTKIRGEETGKRVVSIGQILLEQGLYESWETIIDTTDVSVKEKGSLVVGVGGSRLSSGTAIILIISAEIK